MWQSRRYSFNVVFWVRFTASCSWRRNCSFSRLYCSSRAFACSFSRLCLLQLTLEPLDLSTFGHRLRRTGRVECRSV